jgi:hypothetical protein
MSNGLNENLALKAVIFGGAVAGIDMFVFKETDLNSSLMLAGSASAGIYIADAVASYIPSNFKLAALDGKLVETRILEIGGVGATTYFLDKIIVGNKYFESNLMKRVVTIAAADVISTYATQYMSGQALSFFAS